MWFKFVECWNSGHLTEDDYEYYECEKKEDFDIFIEEEESHRYNEYPEGFRGIKHRQQVECPDKNYLLKLIKDHQHILNNIDNQIWYLKNNLEKYSGLYNKHYGEIKDGN